MEFGFFSPDPTPSPTLPSLGDWFNEAPPGRITAFILASLCTFFTNVLTWKLMIGHIRAGKKESEKTIFFPEIRKKVLYQLFWVNFLSGTSYVGLLLPKTFLFLEFLMATYEAWTLLAFMRMLIDLMGGRIRLLKTLEEQPPRKLFSVMPCCCLVFCDKPRHMTADLVGICRWGAIQAAIVRPFLAAINLFLQLNGGYRIFGSNTVYLVIDVLELISKMTSVFFIFVLYGSTSDVLKRYNIDRKFILLRVMFIPFIVQSFFISFIFTFIGTSEDDIFPEIIAAQSWHNVLTCMEVLPIAVSLFWVYPVHGEFDLDKIPPKMAFIADGSLSFFPFNRESVKNASASKFYKNSAWNSQGSLPVLDETLTINSDSDPLLSPRRPATPQYTNPTSRSIGCQVDFNDFEEFNISD